MREPKAFFKFPLEGHIYSERVKFTPLQANTRAEHFSGMEIEYESCWTVSQRQTSPKAPYCFP